MSSKNFGKFTIIPDLFFQVAMRGVKNAHLATCSDPDCTERVYIPHSCGHRNCPHCQNHENWQWIENQLVKLLPARYYLITFTLPKELRELAWQNQKILYSLMFSCAQDVLKTFTQNDKKLGGSAGFTTVLHTHARNPAFHPHIHVVMPGASINEKTSLWRRKSTEFPFHHKNLAIVDHKLQVPDLIPKKWVVDCKDVGNGEKAIIYLGKYLYKGVIREKDILKCDNGKVTFGYIHSKTGEYRTKTFNGEDFLYKLMLHILPKGFQRTRCYGFLHPCSKKLIKFLQLVLRVSPYIMIKQKKERATIVCPMCGRQMKIVKTCIRKSPALAECFTKTS